MKGEFFSEPRNTLGVFFVNQYIKSSMGPNQISSIQEATRVGGAFCLRRMLIHLVHMLEACGLLVAFLLKNSDTGLC